MAALAALRIDGPPPTAPPYGLVSTPGTIVDEADDHWRAGVVIDSYPSDLPSTHNPCSTGTMRVKEEGTDPPMPEFSSFTVYLPITCSGIGIGNEAGAERLRRQARTVFEAVEGFGVEQEIAFGLSDTSRPHFSGGPVAVDVLGGVVGPREGLALLENAIGETARNGWIHLDPATFTAMAAFDLFDANGGSMRTMRGNQVIIGNGYIGATPGPVLTDDQAFAFATGPMRLTRDNVEVLGPTRETLNRDDNSITFRAERNYVAYWDTALLAGVQVDRSSTP